MAARSVRVPVSFKGDEIRRVGGHDREARKVVDLAEYGTVFFEEGKARTTGLKHLLSLGRFCSFLSSGGATTTIS